MSNKFKHKELSKHNKIKSGNISYYKLNPVFSFAKYKQIDDFYSVEHSNSDKNSLYNFLLNCSSFSKLTWENISKADQFHFHEIEEPIKGLSDDEFKDIPLLQFKLPNHKQGRFVGFIDENGIFNIVLYDYTHSIYKRK